MSSSNIKLLEDFINYSSLRNKVISNNIANVGTSGYRREDVQFKDILFDNLATLKSTNSRHITKSNFDAQSKVITDPETDTFSGINNVNIDEEMAELAKNSIQFKFAAKKIGDHFRSLQKVIKGGGGI